MTFGVFVQNCWNCGRKAYETCSGCHRARYCGTFCQHRHWETHHLTCKPNNQSARSSPPAPAPRDAKTSDHGRSPRAAESRSGARASSSGGVTTAIIPEPPAIDFSTSSTTAQRRNSTSPATSTSVAETTSRPNGAGSRAETATKTAAVAWHCGATWRLNPNYVVYWWIMVSSLSRLRTIRSLHKLPLTGAVVKRLPGNSAY